MKNEISGFDYSVVIRTLGTSGDKYQMLLESVKRQTVQPKEVIVVMAHGYTAPPYHIDREHIVWTRKGMVNQRQVGFEQSTSPYLLVLDDDIAFGSGFVENMYSQMQRTDADCIFPVTQMGGVKSSKIEYIRNYVLGLRCTSHKRNPYYLRIGNTGGTIVNASMREEEQHWCQTANFQCFFIKREMALAAHMEDEMWVEDTGYALGDDLVFFYKSYLNGFKILLTPNICYKHLDAKAGHVSKDKTYKDHFIHQRNITIFWHRFLWAHSRGWSRRTALVLGLAYVIIANTLFYIVKCIVRRQPGGIFKGMDGLAAAFKFIKQNK